MNNAAQVPTLVSQPYPGVGPIISPYEDPKDLNKYTTLKAVGKRLFITNHKKYGKKALEIHCLILLGRILHQI